MDRENAEHGSTGLRGDRYGRMAFNLPVEDDDPDHLWPPYAVETMWVEALGDGRYRVDNIPFFVKPLAVNDIVRGQRSDFNSDLIWFSGRLEWSGHSTVRIVVFADEDEILAALSDMGCTFERLRRIIAVDIPDSEVVERAHAFLTNKQLSGALDLEEACLPDSFPR
ncbi:DUF4265 domain-containing protein [Mycobacterium sp. 360MFTsu5.1]|uniref:DUF4265 domain-containing protein n=1 Tax=Mycobacterium sp. 360MFTsu5.1 TaxID=1172186 RepID=UPI0009DBCD8C|nr:DUF4265 domain-containing protein [Mycobacterium sp. 360MFTsu5.1]